MFEDANIFTALVRCSKTSPKRTQNFTTKKLNTSLNSRYLSKLTVSVLTKFLGGKPCLIKSRWWW